MILDSSQIQVDIKVQDRMRKWLSRLMTSGTLEFECIMLGDSDIDYELSVDMSKARILNAPYNIEAIKYPLIYNGLGKGIKGVITCFARYVDANGDISSYYDYPVSTALTIGKIPPTLQNGYDIDSAAFTNNRMGVIFFIQTLLDYYRDENNLQQRLKEVYEFKVLFNGSETIPSGWQVIKDINNSSLFISKDTVTLVDPSTTLNGELQIVGNISKIQRSIKFNI